MNNKPKTIKPLQKETKHIILSINMNG